MALSATLILKNFEITEPSNFIDPNSLSDKPIESCWVSCTVQGSTYQSSPFDPCNFCPVSLNLSFDSHETHQIQLYLCAANFILATATFSLPLSEPSKTSKTSLLQFSSIAANDSDNIICVKVDVDCVYASPEFDIETTTGIHVQMEQTTSGTIDSKPLFIIQHENSSDLETNRKYEDEEDSPTVISKSVQVTDNKSNSNSDREDEIGDRKSFLRHFRLSIEARSLGGLKRPSHISLHFSYPYLGSGHFVRTKPVWVLANSETKIDGAAVTYDSVMSTDRISSIFSAHALNITAFSKSHLGNNVLGEVVVDLNATLHNNPPHSYRCPITGKTFRQLKDYQKYRQTMLALAAAGRVSRAPPKEPVIIRATDTYLTFSPVKQSAESQSNISAVVGDNKSQNYFVSHVVEGARLRVVVVLEDIGTVGPEIAVPVKPGYKMHHGALYDVAPHADQQPEEDFILADPGNRADLSPLQKAELARLRLDWEGWRRETEARWREALQEKEMQLREQLEAAAAAQLADKADNLRRAQEEQSKLEIRLRASIDAVERQKVQLELVEQQAQMRLAQKTAELQLLQRRMRDEARATVEAETRRADGLKRHLEDREEALSAAERRAREAEKELDTLRAQFRRAPETALREENARLRAQLEASRAETEKEARRAAEARLQAEHNRAQMHRLASALKREREKGSIAARQELEQLRLEFLAKEERYVLDGDRHELDRIRNELSMLKLHAATGIREKMPSRAPPIRAQDYEQKKASYSFGAMQSPSGESKSLSPVNVSGNALSEDDSRRELSTLLSSGFYDEQNDELILELKRNLASVEGMTPLL
eukprot:gene23594-31956_t